MKRVLKIAGFLVLGLVAVAGVAGAWLYVRKPASASPTAIRVEATPARLARGEYLFHLADCDGCHSERDFSRFGGPLAPAGRLAGNVFPREMGLPGTAVAANISPDVETGIGGWTDGEKIRAIREGVDREGRALFPMMPYGGFSHMSDQDVYSLVAYLNSLPAVKKRQPVTRIDFPVNMLIKGEPKPVGQVPEPDRGDRVKYGRYLVQIAGCQDCHKATLEGGEKFNLPGGPVAVSANISPDRQTGIGKWSEQQFVEKFTSYRPYVEKGSPVAGPESFTMMPWLNFSHLAEDDLRAIYAYLRTLPPVNKAVETHPGYGPQAKQVLVSAPGGK